MMGESNLLHQAHARAPPRGGSPSDSQPKPMPWPFVCASNSLATLLCPSQMAKAVPRTSATHLHDHH